jgi:hypothetical protein
MAIVPRTWVRWEVERKPLAEVRIRQMKMPRSLYLVSRRGAKLSHAAEGLMRLLHAWPAFPQLQWRENRESRECSPVDVSIEGKRCQPVPESAGADQEISVVT